MNTYVCNAFQTSASWTKIPAVATTDCVVGTTTLTRDNARSLPIAVKTPTKTDFVQRGPAFVNASVPDQSAVDRATGWKSVSTTTGAENAAGGSCTEAAVVTETTSEGEESVKEPVRSREMTRLDVH